MLIGILRSVLCRECECFVLPLASTNLRNLGWLGDGFVGCILSCVTNLLAGNLATYWGKPGCLCAFVWLQIKRWPWNNTSCEHAWMGFAIASLQYEERFRGGQKFISSPFFDLWLHCTFLLWVKNTRLCACFVKQLQLSVPHMQNGYGPTALSCFPEHFLPSVPMA